MLRILVVDDEPTIRQVIAEILRDEGFEVTVAIDGQQMLDQVEIVPPALILLDVMMPGMTGLDALARMRTRPDLLHIPVVLMSAGVRVIAMDDPGRAFLPKPFEIGELLDVVHRAIGLAPPDGASE
jgi:CheY-like chemotaxis protein